MGILSSIGERLLSYVKDILFILPVVLISLTFHEFSHGYVASKLGDPTAKNEGRLTLNPLKHLDPLGFLMMFLIKFGWAKPVPVNPLYFRDPKKGMMITALAGPVSNLLLSVVCSPFAVFFAYAAQFTDNAVIKYAASFFIYMILINVGLAIFNFIPVYPLDGGRIFGYFMPDRWNAFFRRYGQYIYLAFIVLVIATDYVGIAISAVQNALFQVYVWVWHIPASYLAYMIFG